MFEQVSKPWGNYTNILDESFTKVKKIVIKPGESPSYQYHYKRSEIKRRANILFDLIKEIDNK